MRLLLVLALAALAAACDPDPVGRRCDLGGPVGSAETVFASGSLDCTSRLCLHVGAADAGADETLLGACTAGCATDDDCVADPTSTCTKGFACAPATAVGPFACEPVCVCRDDLAAVESAAFACGFEH